MIMGALIYLVIIFACVAGFISMLIEIFGRGPKKKIVEPSLEVTLHRMNTVYRYQDPLYQEIKKLNDRN